MNKAGVNKSHRKRMRERFEREGLSSFKDHEILEMLLFYSIPRKNTNGIAHSLICEFGDIAGALTAEPEKLCNIEGIGESSVKHFCFLREMYSEITFSIFKDICLNSDDRVGMYAMLKMGMAPPNSAAAVYLDKNDLCINEKWLYKGKDKMTDDLLESVTGYAKEVSASAVILMHNHKLDNLESSADDKIVTDSLREEAKALGIDKIWHIIVADDGYINL